MRNDTFLRAFDDRMGSAFAQIPTNGNMTYKWDELTFLSLQRRDVCMASDHIEHA
jgi:hypothetical protein